MAKLWRRRQSQAGASSIELVLYTPILFMIIFVIVQFALTWHGNQIASAVAREAARMARIDPAALDAAEDYGKAQVEKIGPNGLHDVTVSVDIVAGGDEVRATVRGRSMEIIDGLSPWVEQTVQGPIEEFRPDT